MTPTPALGQQEAFAAAASALLRRSRRDRRLTQAQVAARTGGLISKAALANYETANRSLRIEVFWAIARALGESPGALLAEAERRSGYGMGTDQTPVTVDVRAIEASTDPRLGPVRRWFTARLPHETGAARPTSIILDRGALVALAELMGVPVAECRSILADVPPPGETSSHVGSHDDPAVSA